MGDLSFYDERNIWIVASVRNFFVRKKVDGEKARIAPRVSPSLIVLRF
jgi:hypothetical protein